MAEVDEGSLNDKRRGSAEVTLPLAFVVCYCAVVLILITSTRRVNE